MIRTSDDEHVRYSRQHHWKRSRRIGSDMEDSRLQSDKQRSNFVIHVAVLHSLLRYPRPARVKSDIIESTRKNCTCHTSFTILRGLQWMLYLQLLTMSDDELVDSNHFHPRWDITFAALPSTHGFQGQFRYTEVVPDLHDFKNCLHLRVPRFLVSKPHHCVDLGLLGEINVFWD